MVFNNSNKNYKLYKIFRDMYGLGRFDIENICQKFGISHTVNLVFLSRKVLEQLDRFIKKNYKINEELRNELLEKVRKEYEIKSYKAQRRRMKLPLNGQRSKTNRKTVKKLL
jgi:small subunit ribosomal protein S13